VSSSFLHKPFGDRLILPDKGALLLQLLVLQFSIATSRGFVLPLSADRGCPGGLAHRGNFSYRVKRGRSRHGNRESVPAFDTHSLSEIVDWRRIIGVASLASAC
jgi:hypothetical protein